MVVKALEADIKQMQSMSVWGDKEGKTKRAIENRYKEIKNHYHKFHHLIF